MALQDLLDLLADNSVGGITAADLRIIVTGLYPAPRVPWEDAGGAVPTLGSVNLGTGGTDVTFGTDPFIETRFTRIGGECFGTLRVEADSDGASGAGAVTVEGFPVMPLPVGAGAHGGQAVAYGWLFEPTTSPNPRRRHSVEAVVDPGLGGAVALFAREGFDTADGIDVLVPVAPMPPGFTGLVNGGSTDLFDGDFIINLTFQYEGDLS